MSKQVRKINPIIFVFILIAIATVDVIQLIIGVIPFVGWGLNIVVDVFVGIIIMLWLFIGRHVQGFNAILLGLFAIVAEMIPAISMFPLWSGFIIYIYYTNKTGGSLMPGKVPVIGTLPKNASFAEKQAFALKQRAKNRLVELQNARKIKNIEAESIPQTPTQSSASSNPLVLSKNVDQNTLNLKQ